MCVVSQLLVIPSQPYSQLRIPAACPEMVALSKRQDAEGTMPFNLGEQDPGGPDSEGFAAESDLEESDLDKEISPAMRRPVDTQMTLRKSKRPSGVLPCLHAVRDALLAVVELELRCQLDTRLQFDRKHEGAVPICSVAVEEAGTVQCCCSRSSTPAICGPLWLRQGRSGAGNLSSGGGTKRARACQNYNC